ncbi:MAG: lipocalin family protein [Candidatus Cloacimonetes bacterium]|nr:lipocalin family protein [Candidatus Cloacimonadota bacterium]
MRILIILALLLVLSGCRNDHSDQTVAGVNLEKFMGDWYVISILPNSIEKNAVNSIESYQLTEKGDVDITYTFYQGSPKGKKKVMHPKATIYNRESNSEWRVKFLGLFKFPYLIIWLDDDYETTVIGVPNKKYAWIMSRSPEIESEKYGQILTRMRELGYEVDKLKEIPQIWE